MMFNSYFKDFINIHKEAKKYNVGIDTQNIGNFGLKNGHLAAFDLSGGYGDKELLNLKKIKELEDLYNEISKNVQYSF